MPGTYDDAAREASRQAAADRWLHEFLAGSGIVGGAPGAAWFAG